MFSKVKIFLLPAITIFSLLLGVFLKQNYLFLIPLLIGIGKFFESSYEKIKERKFSLDYIALTALLLSLYLKEFLAGGIIGIMYILSSSLEEYGSQKAEKTLKSLKESFPKKCQLKDGSFKNITQIKEGEIIIIKSNEIIPLDGYLLSDFAIINEANLTGESLPKNYRKGDFLKSGLINIGPAIEIEVLGDFNTSYYQKIIKLVEDIKKESSPFIRLAEKVNIPFTIITFLLSALAWIVFKDFQRVLAVLVIATPCPLLIAVPLSFIGGINKSAGKNIIIKKLLTIEILNKMKIILFDKTGTLTLGEVVLKDYQIKGDKDEKEVFKIAGSLESHSIHPLARSLTKIAKEKVDNFYHVEDFEEKIGEGIYGKINNKTYWLKKTKEKVEGIGVDLFEDGKLIARFIFDDILKDDALKVLKDLSKEYKVAIVSGDRKENVLRSLKNITEEENIEIYSDLSPEEKIRIVKEYQKKGIVGIVGDGINDAPALAVSDVGIVFSGTENSASIEAADIVLLSHELEKIKEVIEISKNSFKIAKESLFLGVGLSCLGMIFAFLGFIPPVYGAIIQEIIDLFVILNSLRSTF